MKFYLSKNISNLLKILSALMVMFHHYSQYVLSHNLSSSVIYKIFSAQGGYLGVAIFFFLSGYGLMESESKKHLNFIDFLKKRILKVYMPVFAVTLIWYTFVLIEIPNSSIIRDKGVCWIISNIIWGWGDDVLWFIKVILFLYVSFYIFTIIRSKNFNWSLLFLIIFTISITFSVAYTMAPYLSISIPYFTLGIVLSIWKEKGSLCLYYGIGIPVLIGISSLLFLNSSLSFNSIINAAIVCVLILIFTIVKIDFYFPTFIGVISFDIYLTHNKILTTLGQNHESIDFFLIVSTTLIFSLIFYLFRTNILYVNRIGNLFKTRKYKSEVS